MVGGCAEWTAVTDGGGSYISFSAESDFGGWENVQSGKTKIMNKLINNTFYFNSCHQRNAELGMRSKIY